MNDQENKSILKPALITLFIVLFFGAIIFNFLFIEYNSKRVSSLRKKIDELNITNSVASTNASQSISSSSSSSSIADINLQVNSVPVIVEKDSDSETEADEQETNEFDRYILTVSKKTLIKHAIMHYKDISLEKKKEILNEIFKVAKEYDINPIIIYSIIDVESDMRFWIKHPPVRVKVPLDANKTKFKTIKTQAIGLGGVIWEIWKYDLQREEIAQVKSDLYDPKINIRAIAYIYDTYRKLPLLKGTDSKAQSALLRYYGIMMNKDGKVNQSYYQKISKSIFSIIQYSLFQSQE